MSGETTVMIGSVFIMLIIPLILLAVTIIPFWMIFSKAGYHGALSLLMLIPLVNLVMLFFLAFAQWPALKKQSEGVIET